MGAAKFEITRKCKICGEPFVAKTITSWYCSPRCSKVAFKRRKDEEKRNERLDAIAKSIPKDQEYITVPEAYSMFGISKETLYRQIRKGVIPSVNVGQRQTRVSKETLMEMYPIRKSLLKKQPKPIPKLYSLEPKDCYTIQQACDVLSAKYPQNLRNFFMILPLSLIKLQKIMISKTYLRYIWLLDTIIGSRESLTYDHIVRMWKGSPYAYMGGLPIRTFHEHRKGIEEMFGVIIECDKSKGYTYYIKNPEVLKQNPYAQLLLRKYSVPQDFSTFNMMRNRILLEEIPHGTAYFDDVVESMRTNTELIIDYQRYKGKRETLTMQPYSMKVYDRRWYVLGYIKENESIRHLALERFLDLQTTSQKFEYPKDFNPRKYYDHVVGIYVNEDLPIVKLKLRVYGVQMEYMRMLPLHKSQSEVKSRYGEFAEFTYRLCLTPELKSKILALGASVEVLEPLEYREEIMAQISSSLDRYMKK